MSSHPCGARPLRWRWTSRSSHYPPWSQAPLSARPALLGAAPEHTGTSEMRKVALPGLLGYRAERASPVPECGCAGRCSAPPTGLLRGDCSETSGPSGTEGGCWRSHDSCRLNLRGTKQAGTLAGCSEHIRSIWTGVSAAPTVGLVGGSRVRRGRRVDERVSGKVGELRDRSQQTARV